MLYRRWEAASMVFIFGAGVFLGFLCTLGGVRLRDNLSRRPAQTIYTHDCCTSYLVWRGEE